MGESAETVGRLLLDGARSVEKAMVEADADWDPQVMALRGEELIVGALAAPGEDVGAAIATVVRTLGMAGPEAVGLISSVWMATYAKTDEDRVRPSELSAEDPRRAEHLLIVYGDADETVMLTAKIMRDGSGPPRLDEFRPMPAGFSGRLADAISDAVKR